MWFKSLAAIVCLSSSSAFSFVAQQTDKYVLPGFHITIKSDNTNNIIINQKWNKMNEVYQNFINNNPNNLITVEFNNWSELSNQKTFIKTNVYKSFEEQITKNDDLSFMREQLSLLGTQAIGNSYASFDLNGDKLTKTFGYVYIPYSDAATTKVNNGIFATVNPTYEFDNYFPVPYTIKPSQSLLNNSNLNERLKTIAINNDSWNPTNCRQLIILAKKPNEQLLINGKNNNVINNNDLAYALVNHKIDDNFKSSTITASVSNSSISNNNTNSYTLPITLQNNTSKIEFKANDNLKDATNITHNYLVYQQKDKQKHLIVMNAAKTEAKVNLFGDKTWMQYNVDPKTLIIDKSNSKPLVDQTVLRIDNSEAKYQVYYLQQQNSGANNNSGQYLVVYRSTTPSFSNWSNFNDANNSLTYYGFQQYLATISDDMPLDKLENNPSQFITYFINYRTDLSNNNFVNYLGNDKNQPWVLNTKFKEITLVNNWKVIIIAGVVILFLTCILPIVIYLFKKEKRLK